MSFLSVGAFLSELFYIIVVLGDCCVCNVFEYQMKTTTFFGNLPGGLTSPLFVSLGLWSLWSSWMQFAFLIMISFAFLFVVGKHYLSKIINLFLVFGCYPELIIYYWKFREILNHKQQIESIFYVNFNYFKQQQEKVELEFRAVVCFSEGPCWWTLESGGASSNNLIGHNKNFPGSDLLL